MPIQHIVTLSYKPNTPDTTKDEIKTKFSGLKESCLLPKGADFGEDAGKKYIVNFKSGIQNSAEGLDKGFEVPI